MNTGETSTDVVGARLAVLLSWSSRVTSAEALFDKKAFVLKLSRTRSSVATIVGSFAAVLAAIVPVHAGGEWPRGLPIALWLVSAVLLLIHVHALVLISWLPVALSGFWTI